MAMQVEVIDWRETYIDLVKRTVLYGNRTAPRGVVTMERENCIINFSNPPEAMLTGIGRKFSTTAAAIEALQLIAGFSTPGLLVGAAPRFAEFLEDDGTPWGSYADRMWYDDTSFPRDIAQPDRNQIESAVNKLRKDPDSRQATVTFWRPELDNLPGKRDYPCTVALNYRIRNDRLNATTFMRSNDVWLGVPYDVFMFTQLQHTMARALGIAVGSYAHIAASLHVYERDFPGITQLHSYEGDEYPYEPQGVGWEPNMPWPHYAETAKMLLLGKMNENSNASEKWYRERVTRAERAAQS